MVYGYLRVYEFDLPPVSKRYDIKRDMLEEIGVDKVFVEMTELGRSHRPDLEEFIGLVQSGDKIVIPSLEDFVDSVRDAVKIFTVLLEKDVSIQILNMGIIDNTEKTKQVKDVVWAIADFEQVMFVRRMSVGKHIAKMSEGFKEGRPKVYDEEDITKALELLKTKSYKQVEALTGISKSTLIRAKKQREANSTEE